MSSYSQAVELAAYDGLTRSEIARRTGCTAVRIFAELPSTMDVAHELAGDGAEAGTLVVADSQTAGRGRAGRAWHTGEGVAFTLLVKPPDAYAAQVLSIRVGMALREALSGFGAGPLQLKWPNDVVSQSGKVAGILIETRWRGEVPDWTAVGVGINIIAPSDVAGAAGLADLPGRSDVLLQALPAVRLAAEVEGALSRDEVQEYLVHDALRGRRLSQPIAGTVIGISEDGELVVSTENGLETARSGSVVIEEEP